MKKGVPEISKLTVHLTAITAMLFWGFSFILSKIVFRFYTQLTTIFFRLLISVFFLFVYLYVTQQFEKVKKKDLWLFFAGAFFNPFLYFIGEKLRTSTCFGFRHVHHYCHYPGVYPVFCLVCV